MKDKTALVEVLLKAIETDIADSERLLVIAQGLVNDAPGAMQSHSDTSRFQGSILVSRQDEVLREKQNILRNLKDFVSTHKVLPSSKVEIGAVFTIKEDGNTSHFFLLPYGGGQEVVFDGYKYCIITLKSPITNQFIGKKAGDTIRVPKRVGARIIEITEIV